MQSSMIWFPNESSRWSSFASHLNVQIQVSTCQIFDKHFALTLAVQCILTWWIRSITWQKKSLPYNQGTSFLLLQFVFVFYNKLDDSFWRCCCFINIIHISFWQSFCIAVGLCVEITYWYGSETVTMATYVCSHEYPLTKLPLRRLGKLVSQIYL